ncbi:ABC transporter substrate-binding protein [Tepidibacter aestuarii]|uniref:ABC transporter substrate-binding protein n=1 Tax=Tepidibacter aestuarii TaxID=2925782 RepID=UPI0020BF73C8|nr:ABC transporter substrate-binding protein [Tepidibacter aestuarii]CAH2212158.1 Carbohydrate ABC transporter substrate-binding protein, CUT1 family [Tepidibacter aestuarii]
MKNLFKKVICLSVVVAILLGVLSGCSTKEEAKTIDGKIEIEYWYGLGGKLGENMAAAINEFNKSQDKYVIKGIAQGSYSETYQSLQASIASGNAPGVVLLDNAYTNTLANKGLLEDLNEFVKNDDSFNEDDFVEAFINQGRYSDKLYALPAYGTTQVLYYNKEAFEKAGISEDSLNTWEGLADAARKLTVKKGDEVVFYGWEPMWGRLNMIDSALSNGAKFLSEDGTKVMINSSEWMHVLESFRKWMHDDKIMRIHYGGQGWEYWYSTIDDVMQDRAAGYTGSSGDQGDLDFNKLAAHEQPAWKGHEARPIAEAQNLAIPIGLSEEEKQCAYEFMKFFTGTKNTAKWSMNTGYIAVRKSATDDEDFKTYAQENPQALVPLKQATHASKRWIDPTGGKIYDAISIAVDKVQIENISAKEALDEAQKTAQRELDKILNK